MKRTIYPTWSMCACTSTRGPLPPASAITLPTASIRTLRQRGSQRRRSTSASSLSAPDGAGRAHSSPSTLVTSMPEPYDGAMRGTLIVHDDDPFNAETPRAALAEDDY